MVQVDHILMAHGSIEAHDVVQRRTIDRCLQLGPLGALAHDAATEPRAPLARARARFDEVGESLARFQLSDREDQRDVS
jgi:hypothetical protein